MNEHREEQNASQLPTRSTDTSRLTRNDPELGPALGVVGFARKLDVEGVLARREVFGDGGELGAKERNRGEESR
jgi:hypothetical protein